MAFMRAFLLLWEVNKLTRAEPEAARPGRAREMM